MSFGTNFHLLNKNNSTLSFIGNFIQGSGKPTKLSYLSITAGVMVLNKKGGHFFIRIGPYIASISRGFFSKGDFGVNVDVGFNFVF